MRGKILVVEDNLITAEVISSQLRKLGYTVANVLTTGEEAVEWIANNNVDLILMDVQLDGEMDGVEAGSFIRGSSEIPIVYLTANSDINTISRASVTRASGYLPKPFDERTMHSTIQMALGRRPADSASLHDRDQLARTFDALAGAVIAIDTAGTVTNMNSLAAEMTGWTSEAAVGHDISDVLQATDSEGCNVADAIPGLFLTADLGPVIWNLTVMSASGECRAVSQIASPVLDAGRRLTGIVLEFRGFSRHDSSPVTP
jgi:PAS domain S-box-containing protein